MKRWIAFNQKNFCFEMTINEIPHQHKTHRQVLALTSLPIHVVHIVNHYHLHLIHITVTA